jgi:ubiquinone/menaquinone biosynthesis C-methylase UbiE
MRFREKLLLKLCRPPVVDKDNSATVEKDIHYDPQCMDIYKVYFGDKFQNSIRNKKVLDFGCGFGTQLIGAIKLGAAAATGIEIEERFREIFKKMAKEEGMADRAFFEVGSLENLVENSSQDVILCQNSFEHFKKPEYIIGEFYRILKPNGKVFVHFGPLWYHPFGGHMFFMFRYPWFHLLFSEKSIMNVRKLYRDDGAEKLSEVEGGLNRMTIKKFKSLVKENKFETEYLKVYSFKNIPVIANIPYIGEFFARSIAAILVKQ